MGSDKCDRIKSFYFCFCSDGHYRPQRSYEGYVFTGVCLSTGGVPGRGVLVPGVPGRGGACSRGVCSQGVCSQGGWLVSQHALRQTPPRERWLLLRMVRILLECILVEISFSFSKLSLLNVEMFQHRLP